MNPFVMRRISVDDFVHDFLDMSKAHYEEVPFHNHERKYDLDIDSYKALEDSGYVMVLAAYDETVPAGYIVVVANPSLHHKGYVDGVIDSFYVSPEYRRAGIMSVMARRCIQECDESGLSSVRLGVNVNFPIAEKLALSLGMDKLETYYIATFS